MEVIKNFIHIIGITPQEEINRQINGSTYCEHDNDYIFIPEDKPGIKSIFQIIIDMKVSRITTLKTPRDEVLVIGGNKNLKIIYTEDSTSNRAVFLEFKIPFDMHINIKDSVEKDDIRIFILDAYFELMEARRIYSSIFYTVELLGTNTTEKVAKKYSFKIRKSEILRRRLGKSELGVGIFLEPRYYEDFEENDDL